MTDLEEVIANSGPTAYSITVEARSKGGVIVSAGHHLSCHASWLDRPKRVFRLPDDRTIHFGYDGRRLIVQDHHNRLHELLNEYNWSLEKLLRCDREKLLEVYSFV